jgi:hypothetical protein
MCFYNVFYRLVLTPLTLVPMIKMEDLVVNLPKEVATLVTGHLKEQFNIEGVVQLTNRDVQAMLIALQSETTKKLEKLMTAVTTGSLRVASEHNSPQINTPTPAMAPSDSGVNGSALHEWSDGSLNLFPETWHFQGYVN